MPSKNRREDLITTSENGIQNPLDTGETITEKENSETPMGKTDPSGAADEDSKRENSKNGNQSLQYHMSKNTKSKNKTKPKKKDTTPVENYDDFFKKRKGIINRVFTKKSPVFKFLPDKTPVEKLDGWRKDNKDKLNERNLLKDTDVDLSTLTWLKNKYYIQLAQNTSDIKFESIVRILKTYDIPVVKSSKIVAAFDTVKEANKIRKFIICKGISCSVAKFE